MNIKAGLLVIAYLFCRNHFIINPAFFSFFNYYGLSKCHSSLTPLVFIIAPTALFRPHFSLRNLKMKTVTLKIDDSINEKFIWLLEHFSSNEIKILEQSEYISDDDYLRLKKGMVQSINEARNEHISKGLKLDDLNW